MTGAIKVLGISGSPRRHGNTETLLDAVLDGAQGRGVYHQRRTHTGI